MGKATGLLRSANTLPGLSTDDAGKVGRLSAISDSAKPARGSAPAAQLNPNLVSCSPMRADEKKPPSLQRNPMHDRTPWVG